MYKHTLNSIFVRIEKRRTYVRQAIEKLSRELSQLDKATKAISNIFDDIPTDQPINILRKAIAVKKLKPFTSRDIRKYAEREKLMLSQSDISQGLKNLQKQGEIQKTGTEKGLRGNPLNVFKVVDLGSRAFPQTGNQPI